MKAKLLNVMPLVSAVATCLTLANCDGGSQRNDQGASFLALGYFDTTDSTDNPPGVGFGTAFISTDSPYIVADSIGNRALDGAYYSLAIGLENRLDSQYIRVERIECDYSIPGSTLNIPRDSMAVSTVLSGRDTEDTDGQVGSGGSGGSGGTGGAGGQIVYLPFEIVSTDILSYINVNRNSLPATPFELKILCRAYGVSTAGFTYVTNDAGFTFRVFDERYEINPPSDGTGSGTTGGSSTGTVTTDEQPGASTSSLPEGSSSDSSSSGSAENSQVLAQPDSNGGAVFGE